MGALTPAQHSQIALPSDKSQIFLSVAHTSDQEMRVYYVIGGDASKRSKLNEVAGKLRGVGLEVLDLNNNYRRDLNIDKSVEGYLVFVQDHLANDADFSAEAADQGLNIKKTYDLISRNIKPLKIHDQAATKMGEVAARIRNFDTSAKNAARERKQQDRKKLLMKEK